MSQERPWFEALASCLPDGVALLEEDWSIIWANRRLAAMLCRSDSLAGLSPAEFVEDFAAVRDALVYRLAHEARADHAVTLLPADGTRIPCILFAVRCGAESPARWSVCFRDASDLEELRRRLTDRDRSHAFLKSGTSDLIVRVDARYTVLWSNEPAASLFPGGTALTARLSGASRSALHEAVASVSDPDTRREIALESAPGAAPYFALRGVLRVVTGEDGDFAGVSMILRDDTEAHRVAVLSRRLGLSPREEEVIGYLVQGYTNLNIASILGITESGVKYHVRNVFARAHVASRTELMAQLMSEGEPR
jgi:DNA-binding CsgD family transcriptional regulator